jgi:hypothetical protein
MTLVTHHHGRTYLPLRQARTDNRAQTASRVSREAMMRGFFSLAVTISLSTAVLAGIIALKTGIYLTHFTC